MFEFKERPENNNFEACVKFVERTWPDDPEDIKKFRAEAVYAISESFFNEIIPSVIQQIMTPSLN